MYNPGTREYYSLPNDHLMLSMPHATCSVCHRLYTCYTDIEIAARLCEEHRRQPDMEITDKMKCAVCQQCDFFPDLCLCPNGGVFYSGARSRKSGLLIAARMLEARADRLRERAEQESEQ